MAPSRLLPPMLGASSAARRLLLGRASSRVPKLVLLPAPPPPSVASAFLAPFCTTTPGAVSRHIRWSSSDARPPKPPSPSEGSRPTFDDFSHLDPNNVQNQEPAARASSSSPASGSASPDSATATGASESRESSASEPRPGDGSSASAPEPPASAETPRPDLSFPSSSSSSSSSTSPSQAAAHNFAAFMDRLQASLFRASQRVNDLTGYSDIETLKLRVTGLEDALGAAQERLHAARSSYKARVAERAATQREVTTLLARQKTWTPADFERFTSLYRDDYDLEAAVAAGARELEDAERDAERLGRDLSAAILARYHEEQIWSDKIRRMSTWGTWGLMGVNVLLFLVFQFGAEPWRRARLVKGFEEKVSEALEKQRVAKDREVDQAWAGGVAAAATAATATAAPPAATVVTAPTSSPEVSDPVPVVVEATTPAPTPDGTASEPTVITEPAPLMAEERAPVSWREALSSPALIKEAALDLVSDRKVALTMRHLSLVALEGAAAGVAVATAVALLFLRRT